MVTTVMPTGWLGEGVEKEVFPLIISVPGAGILST